MSEAILEATGIHDSPMKQGTTICCPHGRRFFVWGRVNSSLRSEGPPIGSPVELPVGSGDGEVEVLTCSEGNRCFSVCGEVAETE